MSSAQEKALPREQVDEVIAQVNRNTGDVLSILERLQGMHPLKYLPQDTLEYVAKRKGLAPSQIYSVATFYSFFNLRPQGRHGVMVCAGTACHTRGAKQLMDGILSEVGAAGTDADGSYTTPDQWLTVRTVACVGQCAMAPVALVDGEILGRISDLHLRRIVRDLLEEDKQNEN